MLEENRSDSDSAESDDLSKVRRPHRSRVDRSKTSADMDRRRHHRRRRGDERTVPEDNHTSNEPRPHHRRRRTRESSTIGHEDASLDKPRDKDHSGRVRRRSSVSSTTRPNRESISERIRTAQLQASDRPHTRRSHKTTRSISPSTSVDDSNSKERSKAREKTPLRITRPRPSSSVKEKSTRPGLTRSSTSVRHSPKVSSLPTVKEEPKVQIHRPAQRSLSVFGNLFGPPRPSVPEEKVSCLTCMDDFVVSKAPMLTCGHRMCYSCLKRIFTLSVTDPAHMPPKCCTDECIPLKHVQKIFDDKFKMRWNRKYQEYTTKNRIYCPAKGCGSWIPPKDITRDKDGRKYGTCRRCKTQVCAICNGKRHKSKECPQDDTTQEFANMAKDNGWQTCYNCSATVELKEGCNHMTCRCTAQFCMICGGKWKTCNCPWFNYAAGNGGFPNYMNVYQVREEIARGGEALAQPQTYAEQLERRREQERRDEEFARRLQGMDLDFGPPRGVFPGIGIADLAGHLFNANFVQRTADLLSGDINTMYPPPIPDGEPRNTRGQARVTGAAAAFGRLARNPSTRQPPNTATRAAPPAIQRSSNNSPFRQPSPPPDPPQRRYTNRSQQVQEDEDTDSTVDKPEPEPQSSKRRPAILAGLNRISDTSRVDAWRQHVTGEPAIRPL